MTTSAGAPDCGRCHDTGRYTWTGIPRLDITPELLHQMAAVYGDHQQGATEDAAMRAGLAAVLELALKPATVEHLCTCKRGHQAAAGQQEQEEQPKQVVPGLDADVALRQLMPVARALYCSFESHQLPADTPYRVQRQATYEERVGFMLAGVDPKVVETLAAVWRQEQERYAAFAAGAAR
ncbi:hypothetical protein [Nonomuraea recticatena]|uniref:Uncharacterized protein n=1 Tax=Nonomuraea recticatena TaxID=46178 RepID=A0ABN3THQ7_9ACTN